MKLFDDVVRNDVTDRRPLESKYTFLNRCARPECENIRTLLEDWFRDYPAFSQASLRGDFRSRNQQHDGAFFELYCHSLLRHQEFAVIVQHVVDELVGKPIDFLVQSDNISRFFLEATVARNPDRTEANQRKVEPLREALNALDSPYFRVSLEIERESSQNLSLPAICRGLSAWLQTLKYDDIAAHWKACAYDDLPTWSWEQDGWSILFTPIPKPREDQGTPGEMISYQLSEVHWTSLQNSLHRTLEFKAKRYGILKLPYVIAVNVLAADSLGSDMGDVLFGKSIVVVDTQSGKSSWTRSPLVSGRPAGENGLWLGRSDPGPQARNRQVSAVLLINGLMPWSVAQQPPLLWHNPWAENPLSIDMWQGPQMIYNAEVSPPQLEKREGKKIWEILALNPNWPNPLLIAE
jgi:hypothetical protein